MWKKLECTSGQPPSARNCVAAAATDDLFIVFGGIGRSEKERFNEIYAYSLAGIVYLTTTEILLFSLSVTRAKMAPCRISW